MLVSLSRVSDVTLFDRCMSFFPRSPRQNHPDVTKRGLVLGAALSELPGQFSRRRRDGVVLRGPGQTQDRRSVLEAHAAALSEEGHGSGVPRQRQNGVGAEPDGLPAPTETGELLPDAEELRDGQKTRWFPGSVPKPQGVFFK